MAEIKTIYKGESVTLLFTFPEAYDMARLASHKVFVGETEFAGVVEGQAIRMQLKSSDTDRMIGTHKVVLWIDDAVLGLHKPYCGDLVVAKTQASGSNASVSNISDIIIPIVISETAITVGDVMYNYMIGRSAYQVWLDAGNTGTVEDYFVYLQQPAADMIASLNETNEAALTAEGLRTGAESIRLQNEQGRVTAESLRVEAETARQTNTSTAIQNTENATALALEVANHPDIVVADYWHKWNAVTNEYETTGIRAKGDVYYSTFEVNMTTGMLEMTSDDDFTNTEFTIDTNGNLILNIN